MKEIKTKKERKELKRKVIFCNNEFINEFYRYRRLEKRNLKDKSAYRGVG